MTLALLYLAAGCMVAGMRIDWACLARPSTHHNAFIGIAGVAITVLTWPLHAADTMRAVRRRRALFVASRRGRLKGGRCPV